MFIQDKINDINERFKVLKETSNIVIWGAGVHTCKLFEKTELTSYDIKDIVDMDERKQGSNFFGFSIKNPHTIVWNDIDAVIISVPKKESQITDNLINDFRFSGKIITLYSESENTPFYLLYNPKAPQVQYFGNYNNWDAAYEDCKGYEDENIINTVINAVNTVRMGGGFMGERRLFVL